MLDGVRGHQARAAEILGIDRRTLYRKLKQYRGESPDGMGAVGPDIGGEGG